MLVDVSDPPRPGHKRTESFKLVRIRHRVPDNTWITGGGWRHHPDVGISQMESHAIEMSIKCWIMGIPHGGAKGGIAFDPTKYSRDDLIAITKKAVEEAVEAGTIGPYIDRWAPDVNTDETIMKWIQDQYSYEMRKQRKPEPAAAVTGKPVDCGGIPGRKEATGRGLHYALKIFRKEAKLKLPDKPTVILQGFGNVGYHFARLAPEFDIKIVAIQDQYGGVYHPNLPLKDLLSYVDQHPQKSVAGFHEVCKGDSIGSAEELFSTKADIALPAALEAVITPEIAGSLRVKVLLEGANGPTLPEADPILKKRGIVVIPDVYCNAGGVILSYFEWWFDTKIDPFDPQLQPPQTKDEDLLSAALQSAFIRNGREIIHIAETAWDNDYRSACYSYAMRRVLARFAMKRRQIF